MKASIINRKLIEYLKFGSVVSFILLFSCKKEDPISEFNPIPYEEGKAVICHWQDNKQAALTFNFDDSSVGQATLALPALQARGLKGTFYVNPGLPRFTDRLTTWQAASNAGHELANHTMHHDGATTEPNTYTEVGDAAKAIWDIRGQADCASLIAFNRGGGTSWNETWLAAALNQYCCYDRQTPLGESYKALSVPTGSNANEMYVIVDDILATGMSGRVHFHGIAANNGNPPSDEGIGGVWINEFNSFLDKVCQVRDKLWLPTFSEVFKYAKERNTSTLSIDKTNELTYTLQLESTLDENYYDQALTIIVCVPKAWTSCTMNYNGNQTNLEVNNGFVVFYAKPNYGSLVLTKI